MENHVTNPNSNEYKLTAIVFDIADHRPFKPVGIKKDAIDKRTKSAPLLVDLFIYSYEADFMQGLLKKSEKKLARSFNSRSVIYMLSFH